MAIYWPTPSFKGRTFKVCVLIRWDFTVCSSPLRDQYIVHWILLNTLRGSRNSRCTKTIYYHYHCTPRSFWTHMYKSDPVRLAGRSNPLTNLKHNLMRNRNSELDFACDLINCVLISHDFHGRLGAQNASLLVTCFVAQAEGIKPTN